MGDDERGGSESGGVFLLMITRLTAKIGGCPQGSEYDKNHMLLKQKTP